MAVVLSTACTGDPGVFRQPIREQRLASGKLVKLVSCAFAWGVEHDERLPAKDGFSLEYLASVPRDPSGPYEQELLEVFELIRPVSEQWGLTAASVTALRTPDRTGTYDTFGFTRSASGEWTHTRLTITRNRE